MDLKGFAQTVITIQKQKRIALIAGLIINKNKPLSELTDRGLLLEQFQTTSDTPQV